MRIQRILRLSGFVAVPVFVILLGCATGNAESSAPETAAGESGVAARNDQAGALVSNVDFARFPSISPDGSEVVFSWRGDLWKCATAGGTANRLTNHSADELRSTWSPDGSEIAFNSTRASDVSNIFLMKADGTDIRPVTDADRSCIVHSFGTDGEGNSVLVFDSSLEGDVYRSSRPYMVSVDGGDLVRIHDAFGSSPDVDSSGRYVLFTRGESSWNRRHYMGPDERDVWVFDRSDGSFKALTKWKGNDGRARWWSGKIGKVLYLSDREFDTVNLYSMDVKQGDRSAKRLTSFAVDDMQDFDVSRDGKTAVLMVWDRLYSLDLTEPNAKPIAIAMRATDDEDDNFLVKSIGREVSEAALSPDGQVMAQVAYGDVYVRNVEEKSPTRRVTRSEAREKMIAWSPDGLRLYYVSDAHGSDSIYAARVSLTRGELKEEFEMAIKLPKVKEEAEEADEKAGKGAGNKEEEGAKTQREGADEEAGDADDGDVEKEKGNNDKKQKAKEEELPKELRPERWHDAVRFEIEKVVANPEINDRDPNPSPDGKYLLFRRERGDLMALDLESQKTRTITTGWDTRTSGRWSPDGNYIAYAQSDMDFNSDIWIVPSDGSEEAVNITRHPDNDSSPRWSADGKILSFISERVNEEFDVWMVYLDADLEAMTPKELQDYYDEQAKAAKKIKPLAVKKPKADDGEASGEDDDKDNEKAEVNEAKAKEKGDEEVGDAEGDDDLDLEDAYLRVRQVTTLQGSEFNNELTPAGDYYIFTSTGDESGLFTLKWDQEGGPKRLSGPVSVQHLTLSGDKIALVNGGHAGTVAVSGGKTEYFDISDSIRIDLQAQASQKFAEAARVLGEQFYSSNMKGLDWAKLSEKYHDLAVKTRTASEFNSVAARFIGELNASHLGVYSRGGSVANVQALGRLGMVHQRVSVEVADPENEGKTRRLDGFEVTQVIPQGPAAKGEMALREGDVIMGIELKPIGRTDTIESMLKGRVGQETIVTIQRMREDAEEIGPGMWQELNVLITPTSYGAERGLKYEAWRNANARKVDEWSDGRLGYIHIQGMNQPSLDVFERDLYAAAGGKDGLIIDVRNNGGGWTTDRLLASIMVQPYSYTIPRGADPKDVGHYPQDRLFIQRYSLPIDLLCNEKSFSNAEIISHAFKALKRGKLVGEQTYGGVISTGGFSLIDGTFVRLPFRGWYLNDGTDMENHGAVPDVLVHQTPEAESKDDDEQLRAAVKDLLTRVR